MTDRTVESQSTSMATCSEYRYDIQRSIRLLDKFMATGWRTEKSAVNHLVDVWTRELEDVDADLQDSIPDGLRVVVYIDTDYLIWHAEIAWHVWFSRRSYGDALKWHEGGKLSGEKDQMGMPLRYQYYRLDTRFPVEPTVPESVRVSTVEEIMARVKITRPRPLSGQRKPGRRAKTNERVL